MILWLHPSHINAERKNFYINCTKTQCFWQLWILTYKFVEVNKNFCTTTPLSQWSKGDKQKCASTTTSKISICHWNSDTSKWGKKKKSPLRIWSDTEWGPTSFFFFFFEEIWVNPFLQLCAIWRGTHTSEGHATAKSEHKRWKPFWRYFCNLIFLPRTPKSSK